MTWRVANRNTMINGSVVMMMPAKSVDQSVWNSPKKRVMPTGYVHFSDERNSAQLLERWPDASVVEAASGEAGAVALAIRSAGGSVTSSVLASLRAGGAEGA